jgi:DNA polymerase-3 subunit alpha
VQIPEPVVPPCDTWGTMEKLRKEREVVGIYISGHPLDDFRIEMDTFCNGVISMFHNLEAIVNREIAFAGVVSEVQHRVSKNGKGWAAFFVEDYNDSYEFRIFGEEYLKMRHFLVPNNFVFFKVFVREGWTNKDTGKKGDPRLQFNSMMQLQDVMETYAKKITLHLKLEDLKQEQVLNLKEIVTTHQGELPLYVAVHGSGEQLRLKMPSRKLKVTINNEFIKALQEAEVVYKLN